MTIEVEVEADDWTRVLPDVEARVRRAAGAALGRIEDAFGRRRSVRNAPRTLDLDLIAYGRSSGDLEGLILPHPRAAERRFVMGPLAEIAPDWRHPTGGRTARELAASASIGSDARPAR